MKQREQDFDETFIWNQYEKRLAILETKNIKICGWTTKFEAIKMHIATPYKYHVDWVIDCTHICTFKEYSTYEPQFHYLYKTY